MKNKIIVFLVILLILTGNVFVMGATVQKNDDCELCSETEIGQDEYDVRLGEKGLGLRVRESPSPPGASFAGEPPYSSFSWREAELDSNGYGMPGIDDWTTSIKDQGSCGSCYSFAIMAALESIIQINSGNPYYSTNINNEYTPIDLSEQYMVSCGFYCYYNMATGGIMGCHGTTFEEPFDFIKREGAIPEFFFRYNSYFQITDNDIYHTPSCGLKVSGWKQFRYEIEDWNYVSGDDDSIKNAIIENGPVVTSMIVYSSFETYNGGVYEPSPGEDPIMYELMNGQWTFAGHMVTIIGYDDSQESWICKNSWNTDWGEGGWFRAKYGTLGINRIVANKKGGYDYHPAVAYFTGIETDPTQVNLDEPELAVIGTYSSRGKDDAPYITFGPVKPGTRQSGSFTIENAGNKDLSWRILLSPASWNKWRDITPDRGTLTPGESVEINVEITPYTFADKENWEDILIENVHDDCVDIEYVWVKFLIQKSKSVFNIVMPSFLENFPFFKNLLSNFFL
jgi:hypothetical protein